MYFRTYFDKDTVINKDSNVNLGANGVAHLYTQGTYETPYYSRYLFHFDETNILKKFSQCEFPLSGATHTLVFKPIRNLAFGGACNESSYRLCLFPLEQEWNEGCGYDERCDACYFVSENCNVDVGAANWFYATSIDTWDTPGVFDSYAVASADTIASGNTFYLTCFESSCSDGLIRLDVTDIVNTVILSGFNYGFGLALSYQHELNPSSIPRGVSFYTRNTNTFFEPYLESEYINPVLDDRNLFYIGKENSLYLYTNVAGNPTKLDNSPIVSIYDDNEIFVLSGISECVGNGIYKFSLTIDITGGTACTQWKDVWSNIKIKGKTRPNIEMYFELLDDLDYYQFGTEITQPKKYHFAVRGILNEEYIERGDNRKLFLDTMSLYDRSKVLLDEMYYKLYIKDGEGQLIIIDWTPVNRSVCDNWIMIETDWMLPQTYYLDFKTKSGGEYRTYEKALRFNVIEKKEY